MRYRNIVTGIEFTTSCRISGADFVEVKPEKATPEAPKEEKASVKDSKPKTTTTKRAKK